MLSLLGDQYLNHVRLVTRLIMRQFEMVRFLHHPSFRDGTMRQADHELAPHTGSSTVVKGAARPTQER